MRRIAGLLLALVVFISAGCSHPVASPPAAASPAGTLPQEYGDYRGKDVSTLDFESQPKLVWTLNFDTDTRWPASAALPEGFDQAKLLEWAKNPGLGLRQLHEQGATGKGVHVAYVDQPLPLNHPAYTGAAIDYHRVWDKQLGENKSMHGPSVTSLLLGKEIGVAPAVNLHFFAFPSWLADQQAHADAIHEIMALNQKLPADQKIRVLGFSDAPDTREKNIEAYQQAIKDAEAAGILVVDVVHPFKLMLATIEPYQDRENPANWGPDPRFTGQPPDTTLLVPADNRTTASVLMSGRLSYIYWAQGGMSWTVPYVVGTLALGWEADPHLTNENAVKYLVDSGTPSPNGGRVINPAGFLELVKQNKR
jgi:hypothetical protein